MSNEIQATIEAPELADIADIVTRISAHTPTQEFSVTFKIPDLSDLEATRIREHIEDIIKAQPSVFITGKIKTTSVSKVSGTPPPPPPSPQTSMLDDAGETITISYNEHSVTMSGDQFDRAAKIIGHGQPIDLGGI